MRRLEDIGLYLPEILIPAKHMDYRKWSVVACDQFTSQPEYWESVERYVGESASSLRVVLPEAYLGAERLQNEIGQREQVEQINSAMAKYLADGTLQSIGRCAVYTERTQASGKRRKGLVLAIDLEKYDYSPSSKTLIRPSEDTVPERLPPRVGIRRNAPIETPHTIMLFNDKGSKVFLPFEEVKISAEMLYDFELMMGGGHLTGYRFDADTDEGAAVFGRFVSALLGTTGESGDSDILFAVGDGNHSLAAAKTLWEKLKSSGAGPEHPARYSMVEIENVYDDAIDFEPIHRVIFGIHTDRLIESIIRNAPPGKAVRSESRSDRAYGAGNTVIPFRSSTRDGCITIMNSTSGTAAGILQKSLQKTVETCDDVHIEIDYVHGKDALDSIIDRREDATGFYMPEINKSDFFDTIIRIGRFPLKAFSIGRANEKRYYLECRKITDN